MIGAELAPLELAGRLALALGLAVFLGLAFEEVYKREERSTPGGYARFRYSPSPVRCFTSSNRGKRSRSLLG